MADPLQINALEDELAGWKGGGEPTTRIQREAATTAPGSQRAAEIARENAQQHNGRNFVDGLGLTAAAGAKRVLDDELATNLEGVPDGGALGGLGGSAAPYVAVMTLFGYRKGEADYDKNEHYDALTKDIPYEYHDDIMENDNMAAASRARARVQEDLERGQRIAQQRSGTLSVLAGSLFDVDLPMVAFSGGAYGSAKAARAGMKVAKLARLSPSAAVRAGGLTQGVNAGVQAGAIVGAVDAGSRETVAWQDMVEMVFASAALGGAIGTGLKGDVRSSFQGAQDEFHAQIARDDPALRDNIDHDQMFDGADDLSQVREAKKTEAAQAEEAGLFAQIRARDASGTKPGDPEYDAFTAQPKEASTAGAANINSPTYQGKDVTDPLGPISPTSREWIETADQWRYDTGWGDKKVSDDAEWWSKVANSAAGSFSTNDFMQMYRSNSALANYVAGVVFESPHGLGRGQATAATRMENYHRRIQQHIARDVETSLREFAKETGQTWQGSGYFASGGARQGFNREVMLELNDRAHGRNGTSRSQHVRNAADQYEKAGNEALGIGRGRNGETPVDGFDAIPDRRGYTPYGWNGRNILALEKAGTVTRKSLVAGLADSYRRAGMATGKDADAVATAVIQRAVSNEADIDMSVVSLLSGDGKEWLLQSLRQAGLNKLDRDAIMDRLGAGQSQKGKESFAKMRNEVDMDAVIKTEDGSDLRIVDLMDNDLHLTWQRYSRRMAGSAALARNGITNRVQRKEVIAAMQAEQRSLGEVPIDAERLDAMFTHFDGGPVAGYSRGHTNSGVGSEIATIKRITNLALLGKLGVTQLMEEGAKIAQNGVHNWAVRSVMSNFDKQMKAGNKELLADMAYVTGKIGDDHRHFATWLDLDDVSDRDKADWLSGVSRLSSNGQWIQGYTSLFNHVRSYQQTTAAMGMADKVMRTIKAAVDKGESISAKDLRRFESDLGLTAVDVQRFEQLIANGVIEFKTTKYGGTFVDKLNLDRWDVETAEIFGSSITRNVNQIVQKSMAGEQDAWMHTQWGSIITHLKTFPMQAFSKQFIRNMRHMDGQAVATLMFGMATASVALRVRDAIDGTDRSEADYAKAAFSYSNMTSFVPMLFDPAMTVLGMDDMRFNAYGPYSDLTPPTVKIANNVRRAPGALWNAVQGDADYYDWQALKALPYANSLGMKRMWDSLADK